jgi:GNAT superfamily N-acetyltransferase
LISVRPVRVGDGEILVRTTRALGEVHGWADKMLATAEGFESALFCTSPIIGAVIAEVDGVPAGSALWHRSYSTTRGREVMYLEDLIVLPEFRRLGVADALMKEVAKAAINYGYDKIFWLMMAWNSGARSFYEGIGAVVENDNCYCSIEGKALENLSQ